MEAGKEWLGEGKDIGAVRLLLMDNHWVYTHARTNTSLPG